MKIGLGDRVGDQQYVSEGRAHLVGGLRIRLGVGGEAGGREVRRAGRDRAADVELGRIAAAKTVAAKAASPPCDCPMITTFFDRPKSPPSTARTLSRTL